MGQPIIFAVEKYHYYARRRQHDLKSVVNYHVLKVNKKHAYAHRTHDHGKKRIHNVGFAEYKRARYPHGGARKLDYRVAERDVRLAAAALSAQNDIGDDGNIVVPF